MYSSSSVVMSFTFLTFTHLPFLIIVDSPGVAMENLEISPDNVLQTSPLHDAFGPRPFSTSDHSSHSMRYSSSSGTSVEASEHGLASAFLFTFRQSMYRLPCTSSSSTMSYKSRYVLVHVIGKVTLFFTTSPTPASDFFDFE